MYNKTFGLMKTFLSLSLSLTFLFVFFFFSPRAYAESISLKLDIKQNISIDSPYAKPKDNFTYFIEATSNDASLPEAGKQAVEFKIKGDSEKELRINYQKPGEYEYKIYQKDPDRKNVIYDIEVYRLYVKVIESDGKMIVKELLIKNSSNHKVSKMIFENIYTKKEGTTDPMRSRRLAKLEKAKKQAESLDPEKSSKPTKIIQTEKSGDSVSPTTIVYENEKVLGLKDKIARLNVKTGVEGYITPLLSIIFISGLGMILTKKKENKD